MSNQQAPTRPWFRLASISRPASQEPTPTPALPRLATIPPAFSPPTEAQLNASAPSPPAGIVSSGPSSPADKKPTVPGSPMKTVPTAAVRTTSPVKPMVSNTTAKESPAKIAPTSTSVVSSPTQKPASSMTTTTLMSSPKSSATTVKPVVKNQIQSPSPKTKPPTAEAEQKMIYKPKGWSFGALQEKGRGKKYSSDSDDAGMRIITITGDNKGAFMKINQSAHHNSSSSSEAGDRKMKSKSNWTKKIPLNAFINSNVQGINNSIVYNSSCTNHDPGVHVHLTL